MYPRRHRIRTTSRAVPALCLASALALAACAMEAGDPAGAWEGEVDDDHAALDRDIGTLQGQPNVFAKGWVWADQAAVALNTSYTPSTLYQLNSRYDYVGTPPSRVYSPAATNTVTRLGTGSYRVTFPNLSVSGGTVHVTAYGGNHHCKVSSWGGGEVYVRCFNTAGALVNGQFTVLFYKDGDMGSQIYSNAYLWADQPSAASCYTPSPTYQFNSRGGTNTVCRLGVGEYEATLPDMEKHQFEPSAGGHVQVTAYGAGAERCKVRNWIHSGSSVRARVGCINASGAAADSRFTLSYMRSPGTLATAVAEDRQEAYFVLSDGSPIPPPLTQTDSYGNADATMQQVGTGVYRLNLPYVKAFNDTTALVTAVGSGSAHCTLSGWFLGTPLTDTAVEVRCYDNAGAPVSSNFALLYVTNRGILF